MVRVKQGLKVKPETYKEFGKFMISLKYLDENLLIIKYLSYAPVPSIRRTKVSDDFKKALSFLLDTDTINYQLAQKLSISEKKLFTDLIIKSGLKTDLKFDPAQMVDDVDELIKHFYVCQGEVNAGNNNPELNQEIKKVVEKLVHYGKISPEDGTEILNEL